MITSPVKMKLLAAPDRYDDNKALQDLDDAKTLVSKLGIARPTGTTRSKAAMKAALEEFLLSGPPRAGGRTSVSIKVSSLQRSLFRMSLIPFPSLKPLL